MVIEVGYGKKMDIIKVDQTSHSYCELLFYCVSRVDSVSKLSVAYFKEFSSGPSCFSPISGYFVS